MVENEIKIRARLKGDITEIKALMAHPMETGFRSNDETGGLYPAHYIREITIEHNGETVMTIQSGPPVSKNPYLALRLKDGQVGDKISLHWLDNLGHRASGETTISDYTRRPGDGVSQIRHG